MKFANKTKVKTLIEDKGGVLIDLRTPVDYRNGSIDGAKNLPLTNFINSFLKFDKAKPIVLIVNFVDDADLKTIDTYAMQLGYEKIWAAEYNQLRDAT
jgi:3-mercaptopyruvate sulfurtransferase SseA